MLWPKVKDLSILVFLIRKAFLSYTAVQNCVIYLLQETFSQPQNELIWKTEWHGKIFFSHGSNHQKGVAIFINPLFEITFKNSWEDEDGRIVLINAFFETFKFSLCNIYAPNNTALQKVFIENLTEILISKADSSNLIIAGDWNVTLEAVVKKGGIQWKPSVYSDLLAEFMDELILVDILRIKNPGKRCFTYESSALKMKSRIDFFLIPKSLIVSTTCTRSQGH